MQGSATLRGPKPTRSIYDHQLTVQDVDGGLVGANPPGFGGMKPFLPEKALDPTCDVPPLAAAVPSATAGSPLDGFPDFVPPAPVGYQSRSFGTTNTLPELGDFADATSSPLRPPTPKAQEQSLFAPPPRNGASFGVLGDDSLSVLACSPSILAFLERDYGAFAGTADPGPLSTLASSPTSQYSLAFLSELENGYPYPEPGWFDNSVDLSQLNAAPSLGAGTDLIPNDHAHHGALQDCNPTSSTAGRSSTLAPYASGPQRILDPLQIGCEDPCIRPFRSRRSPASFRAGIRVKGSRRRRRSSESRSPSAAPSSGRAAKQSGQYPCAAQGCPKTYSRKTDADRHYRSEHDPKAPRYIDRCGYNTTRKEHYMRHHGLDREDGPPCNRPPCRLYHACRCGELREDKNEHLCHVIGCRRGQGNLGRPIGS